MGKGLGMGSGEGGEREREGRGRGEGGRRWVKGGGHRPQVALSSSQHRG